MLTVQKKSHSQTARERLVLILTTKLFIINSGSGQIGNRFVNLTRQAANLEVADDRISVTHVIRLANEALTEGAPHSRM